MDLFTPPSAFKSEEKPASHPPDKKRYTDWQFETGGSGLSQRPSCTADLLQNCDLPPPLRVFSPIQEDERMITTFSPVLSHRQSIPTVTPAKVNQCDGNSGWNHRCGSESTGLLRALQLSQTRAREAEKKASLASTRNKQMAALLLEESLTLFAHRQWVKLLEIEISMLRENRIPSEKEERDNDDDDEDAVPARTWCLALALCLSIAGVGFVFSRYLF